MILLIELLTIAFYICVGIWVIICIFSAIRYVMPTKRGKENE